MRRLLIITADDFGFSHERNKGVMEAFNKGAVASASLLLNCTGTQEAAALFKSNDLCPGLHLNLTEGVPISRSQYQTLTNETGNFHGMIPTPKMLEAGIVDEKEIKKEIECQIEKFKELVGREPVYVDGHQHIHLHPEVIHIFASALQKYNIKITRLPLELNMPSKEWVNPELMPFFIEMMEKINKARKVLDTYGINGQVAVDPELMSFFIKRMEKTNKARKVLGIYGIKTTDSFVGLSTMGKDMTSDRLQKIILEAFEDAEKRFAPGSNQPGFMTCELMTHPGYPTHRVLGGFSWGSDDFGCSEERIHEINVLSSQEMKEFYKLNDIEVVSHKVLLN